MLTNVKIIPGVSDRLFQLEEKEVDFLLEGIEKLGKPFASIRALLRGDKALEDGVFALQHGKYYITYVIGKKHTYVLNIVKRIYELRSI
jgi:hypothetical protein